ncbi:PhoH family protein [bacterium]|nr:PhoH family protein [bacterium]
MEINLVSMDSQGILSSLYGPKDENLKYIENSLNVKITAFKGIITIKSDDKKNEEKAYDLIYDIANSIKRGYKINKKTLRYLVNFSKEYGVKSSENLFQTLIKVGPQRGFIQPKTFGQETYIKAMKGNEIIFCIGPAGTGKTYLAVARAVEALLDGEVERIVVTRPAVEAGEKLGFLPGDIQQKIDPYLRPVYDALFEHLTFNKVQTFIEDGVIEIAPLAFMRGRTLNNAFIILDEAQNTSREQMKMFLTRIGHDSKTIVNGDITQIDLPKKNLSGLLQAIDILNDIDNIKILHLSKSDVVRHELVQKIIEAFEKYEKKQ